MQVQFNFLIVLVFVSVSAQGRWQKLNETPFKTRVRQSTTFGRSITTITTTTTKPTRPWMEMYLESNAVRLPRKRTWHHPPSLQDGATQSFLRQLQPTSSNSPMPTGQQTVQQTTQSPQKQVQTSSSTTPKPTGQTEQQTMQSPLAELPTTTIDPNLINAFFNADIRRLANISSLRDLIVNAVPLDPSKPVPLFNSISGRVGDCKCVTYSSCRANRTDTSSADGNSTASNSTSLTFETIEVDLRFGGDDELPACDHYLEVCCTEDRIIEGANGTAAQVSSFRAVGSGNNSASPIFRGCGVRSVGGIDFKITGSSQNEAGFGEFPWTVALLLASNSSYFCAGSLIHPRVVLTAYHCISNMTVDEFIVRAGEWDTQTTNERLAFEERSVQRVIAHPQYRRRDVSYDFALVILDDNFNIAEHINTVCLPEENALPLTDTICTSTGWGKDRFGAEGRYASIMKRVELPLVEFNQCQEQMRGTRLGRNFTLHPTFICAGGKEGVDTCQGDGGAALVYPLGLGANRGRYQQIGIVAWGIGCHAALPGVYANVASVRGWIDLEMLKNGFGTTTYTSL